MIKNISSKLEKKLPPYIKAALGTISNIAEKRGQRVFLVGGIVRDIILGHRNHDLDIVIEGDAIEFSREIPIKPGKVINHTDFRTVKLVLQEYSIDISTARTEIYERPGALPKITPSNIENDLARRDFTINAMAVNLCKNSFGELLDPFNGYQDIKNRLIRILHNKSFIDDATRMFRAIRYEQRLNFKLEGETQNLLINNLNMIHTLTSTRVRNEINLILKERKPENIINRGGQLGILNVLHPSIKYGEILAKRFKLARKKCKSNRLQLIYLLLLFYDLKEHEIKTLKQRIHFTNLEIESINQTVKLKSKLDKLAVKKSRPSKIYFLLRDFKTDAIKANYFACDDPLIIENLKLYLTKLQKIKLSINGNDLVRLGLSQGSTIRFVLNQILKYRIDGKIHNRVDEIELAKKLISKLQPNDFR